MTDFATNLAAGSARPVYVLEVDPELVYAFDTATGWSATGQGSNVAADTSDAKQGAASLGFDKSGTGGTTGGAEATALTAMDLSSHRYLSVWIKIPSVTDLGSFKLYAGQDASNRYEWTVAAAEFSAGWNFVRLPFETLSNVTYSTTGSPTRTAVVYLAAEVVLDANGNTLTGIRVDFLGGHPYRYSWGKITSPRTTTRNWMSRPQIGMVQYRPQDGTVSIAPASVKIVDDDGTSLISDLESLIPPGRAAKLWMGFRGEIESDTTYSPIYRGIIKTPEHVGRGWKFGLADTLSVFDVAFAEDATEAAPLTVTGTILTVFLKLALSTGNGNNNGNGSGTYDTLSAGNGAGISADFFDVSNIESLETEYRSSDSVSFTFTEPQESLLKWAQDQVFKVHGIVPALESTGLMALNVVRAAFGTDAVDALDRTNVISAGKIPSFQVKHSDVVNKILVRHSWNTSTEEFDSVDSTNTYTDDESIDRYGERLLVLESYGITSDAVASRCARRLLRRLANGAPPLKLEAFRSEQDRVLGQLPEVTIPRLIPDLTAKTYGLDGRLHEVVAVGYDPATGKTSLTLQQTTYRQGNYRKIGPSGIGDYTGWTNSQKANYGAIGASGTNLLNSGNEEGHVIGPGA